MTQNFDFYEFLMKRILNLDASKRLDLRISLMMALKIGLLYFWYLYLEDDSKFEKISIGINICTWPPYHLYFVVVELHHLESGYANQNKRRGYYRCLDQLQNLILLIEFCVLVFEFHYQSVFHIVVVTFLILDNLLFIFTLALNSIIIFKRKIKEIQYLDSLPKDSEKLAKEISSQIAIEKQSLKQTIPESENNYIEKAQQEILSLDQKKLAEKIHQHVKGQLQLRQSYSKGDIFCQIIMRDSQEIELEPLNFPSSQIFKPPAQMSDSDKSESGDKYAVNNTLDIFQISFIIAAVFASLILYYIVSNMNTNNQSLIWLGFLEISGNVVIVIGSIYLWCKYSEKSICQVICNGSCIKIISTILQGFVFGLTCILYGVIFGAIALGMIILACICWICCGQDVVGSAGGCGWLNGWNLFWLDVAIGFL